MLGNRTAKLAWEMATIAWVGWGWCGGGGGMEAQEGAGESSIASNIEKDEKLTQE